MQCPADRASIHRPVVLELSRGLRGLWRALSGRAARAHYGRRAAAALMAMPSGQPQHRGIPGRRSGLGRPGHDRRDDGAAGRRALRHRACARARQARGGRRARRDLVAGGLRGRRFPASSARRKESSTPSSRRGTRARRSGVFEAREVQDRRHHDADPALRSV